MESLFLESSNRGELRFRIATNGSWYLSPNNFEKRRYYFDMFLKAYDRASKVIHANPKNKTNIEDAVLIEKVQDACREGLLKRIDERQHLKWNDIILGAREEK